MDDKDLKNLVLQGLLHGALASPPRQKAPMSAKEERELLDKFSAPDFPEAFAFVIKKLKHEPGKLFSRDALEKALHSVRLFIGGRILGAYKETNREPEVLVVTVQVQHMTKEEFKQLESGS